MSKGKKNKRKNANITKSPAVKKYPLKTIVIAIIIILIIAGGVITAVIYNSKSNSSKTMLTDYGWKSVSAHNASNDEVALSEIYNTVYSTYKGTLNFNADGTFSFWLTPGSSDDGTHSGKYVYNGGDSISMVFDNGTETVFNVIKSENGSISGIKCLYDDYTVYFEPDI